MATKKVSRAKNAGRIVHTLGKAVHHPGILLLPEAGEYVFRDFFFNEPTRRPRASWGM